MLTICGQTFGEVFAALADRKELSSSETAAARKMAEWFAAYEQVQAEATEATVVTGDRGAYDRAETAMSSLRRCQPWRGTLLVGEGETRTDTRYARVGRIQFTIAPHTNGATMNVGIDRV